jgi:uncharacterized protein YciI
MEGAMFVVELEFSGDPARLELRPQHRERLNALHEAGVVRLAGPWADESGAILVLDVPDEAGVHEVLDADPYYRAPGVTVRRIVEWNVIVG